MENREQLNLMVENGLKVERLIKNKDFVDIITELYMKDSLCSLALNLNNFKKESREYQMEAVLARGYLAKFLETILTEAYNAKMELSGNEDGGEQ
jgi:uncharacterized membrane protein